MVKNTCYVEQLINSGKKFLLCSRSYY